MNSERIDVVVNVIESDGKYLLGKRSSDGLWEFIGGKIEDGENLKEAAVRETVEETGLEISKNNLNGFHRGDSYLVESNNRYCLNPVSFSIPVEKKDSMSIDCLSSEHSDFAWIELTSFDEYKTKKQYQALENLGVVNGRVVLSAVEKNGKYLLVKRSSENSSAGRWGFVSGKIEQGETVEEASVRELKEETGLEAEPVSKGSFYIGEGEKGYWRLEPVEMKYISGSVDLNWELSEHNWLTIEEIENTVTMGSKKSLEKLDLN